MICAGVAFSASLHHRGLQGDHLALKLVYDVYPRGALWSLGDCCLRLIYGSAGVFMLFNTGAIPPLLSHIERGDEHHSTLVFTSIPATTKHDDTYLRISIMRVWHSDRIQILSPVHATPRCLFSLLLLSCSSVCFAWLFLDTYNLGP